MTEDPTFYSKMAAYGDRDDSELQDRLNEWKSFWIDAGEESAELYKRTSSNITKLSLLPENKMKGCWQNPDLRK